VKYTPLPSYRAFLDRTIEAFSVRVILIGCFYAVIDLAQAKLTCEPFANEISANGAYAGKKENACDCLKLTLNLVYTDAWNATSDGFQCISFNSNISAFNVTWQWPTGQDFTRAYPHIAFLNEKLPIQFSNITSMDLQVTWQYKADPSIIGNVAVDMFADTDINSAQDETLAAYEIMVWYADYGGAWPLGYSDGPKANVTISDVI
jgi:hypothetical protein